MTYEACLEYLNAFADYEKTRDFRYPEDLSLDRVKRLLKALGNPQNAFESIIIAGSKGKGSTAAILSSILRMENLRVGLYTSPHLLDLKERIGVNGLLINEVRFAQNVDRISHVLDGHAWRKDPPTYFELLTAIAFCHFKELKVQVAVLEVGLGGLYDATNAAPAKVVGLSPISLEHTDKLGKTLAKIAVQKCGVIKGREVVVSAPQTREVGAVINDTVKEREAQLIEVGKDIRIFERQVTEDSQRFDLKGPLGNIYDVEIRLRGYHQIENAALAYGLAKALERKTRWTVSESAVRQGLLDARWPGRLEKVSERLKIVLDGAHNTESMVRMLQGLKRHFKYSDLIVVFGSSGDKDVDGILKVLLPPSSCVILTRASHPRAMETRQIREKMESYDREIFIEEDVRAAIEKAKFLADRDDLILVTGSLFLVADAKRYFGRRFQ